MTNTERHGEAIIQALENIIEERGKLRGLGFAIDALPNDFNDIIDAARSALWKRKSK